MEIGKGRVLPEKQPPPVQRVRLRYVKRGRLRFLSHRDFSRAFERAVLRAHIPMSYSSGFHPHPRISYAGAAPTGAASEAEYVEIALARVIEPADAAAAINAVMPAELVIEAAANASETSLADLLQASEWVIDLPYAFDVAEPVVSKFRDAAEVTTERMTKKGLRTFDARAAVVSMTAVPEGSGTRLRVVLRHGEPMVRPDDVVTALQTLGDWPLGPEIGLALMTRLSQGPLDEATGTVLDPLAIW